jgi:hypothetical protein
MHFNIGACRRPPHLGAQTKEYSKPRLTKVKNVKEYIIIETIPSNKDS